MNYVLRDRATGRFLQRVGVWAERATEAMLFADLLEAREYCQAHRLEGLDPVRRLRPYLLALIRRRRAAGFTR